MTDPIYKLIQDVGLGNPGAYTVIQKLEWYSKWHEMLRFLRKKGIVGGALWAKWKDEYHYDTSRFVLWLEDEMARDREFEHFYNGPLVLPRPWFKTRKFL